MVFFVQKVLTEDDERQDSDTDSNFSPALKKKAPLGELPERFSATLNEYGPAGSVGAQAHKRARKSPSPTPRMKLALPPALRTELVGE